MRFFALLFLLSVFSLVACSSDELTEVVLTDSERGSLRLFGTPAYASPEKLLEINQDSLSASYVTSFHTSVYHYGDDSASRLTIKTIVLNSPEATATTLNSLSAISEFTIDQDEFVLLSKGNTIVILTSQSDSYPVSDLADKLSKRLDMEIVG